MNIAAAKSKISDFMGTSPRHCLYVCFKRKSNNFTFFIIKWFRILHFPLMASERSSDFHLESIFAKLPDLFELIVPILRDHCRFVFEKNTFVASL
jgi:hypothetical protein